MAIDPVFSELESEVRTYSRDFPTVFATARGATLWDRSGKAYIDFFAGAGALNYGHNNPRLKKRILSYLADDGVTHSLDMATEAKAQFLVRFREVILKPRRLPYKVQFTGPTGTNGIEAALKLARRVTGRSEIGFFSGSFHGMTQGALSVAGDAEKRSRAGIPLGHTFELPFECDGDGLAVLEERCRDERLRPAAVIVETLQAEGGVRVASPAWLQRLAQLADRFGVLLLVDDIQVGCGRTGDFFSFERAGIVPDLVCLSKSIGGYGLPMSLVLIRADLDVWRPGEHNGTFRGQNLAFVAGTEALAYWEGEGLAHEVRRKAARIEQVAASWQERFPSLPFALRGLGLIQGLDFADPHLAGRISQLAFERGLVIETAGPGGRVLKFLPPLLISEEELERGLSILEEVFADLAEETEPALLGGAHVGG